MSVLVPIYGEIDLPSSMTGYARNKSESAYPELWDGLVGYWDFSVQGTIPPLGLARDLSGNGKHGTLAGDLSSVPGKYGPALGFDGTGGQRVEFGKPVPSTAPAHLSIMWWSVANKGAADFMAPCRQINGRDSRIYVSSAEKVTAQIDIDGAHTNLISVSAVENNVLQFWAYTYDGAFERLYLNGVEDNSRAETGALDSGALPFIMGEAFNNGWTWQGTMEMFLIYNQALSASEIKFLYGKPKALVTPRYRLVAVAGEAEEGIIVPLMSHHYTKNIGAA